MFDVAIVGGGPAGAHAAYKAALLFRTAVLIDKGRRHSRIYYAPKVDNLPGQLGVPGRKLIARGYQVIAEYEAEVGHQFVTVHEDSEVTAVRREKGAFVLAITGKSGATELKAKALIIATGAVDRQPQLREFRQRNIEAVLPYANKGLADYCLLCDGHTVEGKRVAVIGCDPGSRTIAKSLKRNFHAQTAIVPMCHADSHGEHAGDPMAPWEKVEEELATWGIPIHFGDVQGFTGIKEGRFGIQFADRTEWFDKAWISMGWYKVNGELAQALGGKLDANGFVVTDPDGRVRSDHDDGVVPGLYAIGDVRSGSWKQIPIAWGQAEAAVIDIFVSH
jgi:thioredoxin reductase (NADPH)